MADRAVAFPQCFQPVPPSSPPPPSPRPSPPPPMPRPPPSPVPTSGSWTVPMLVTALPYTSTVVSVSGLEGGWLQCRSLDQHAACSAAAVWLHGGSCMGSAPLFDRPTQPLECFTQNHLPKKELYAAILCPLSCRAGSAAGRSPCIATTQPHRWTRAAHASLPEASRCSGEKLT